MDKLLPNFDVKKFTKHELEQLQKVFQKQQEFEKEMETSLKSPKKSPISPLPLSPIESQQKAESNRSMKSLTEVLKPPPIIAQLSKSSEYLPPPKPEQQQASNDDQTSSSTSRLDPFFSKIVSLKDAVNKNLSFSTSTSASSWKADVPIPTSFLKRFSSPQPPSLFERATKTEDATSQSTIKPASTPTKSKKTSLQEEAIYESPPISPPSSSCVNQCASAAATTTTTTSSLLTSRIERFKLDYTSSKQTVRSIAATSTRVDSVVKYSSQNQEKEISFTKFEVSSSSSSSSPLPAHLLTKKETTQQQQQQQKPTFEMQVKPDIPKQATSPRKMPSPVSAINNTVIKSNDNSISDKSLKASETTGISNQGSFKKQLPKLPDRKEEVVTKVEQQQQQQQKNITDKTDTRKDVIRKEIKSTKSPIILGNSGVSIGVGVGVGGSSKFDFSRSYPVQTPGQEKTTTTTNKTNQTKNWRRLRTKLTSVVWLSNPTRKRTCGKEPQLETIKDDDLFPPTTNSSQDSPDRTKTPDNYYGAAASSRITTITSSSRDSRSIRRKDNDNNNQRSTSDQVFQPNHPYHQTFNDVDYKEKSGDSAIVCDSSYFIYPTNLEFNETMMMKLSKNNKKESGDNSSSILADNSESSIRKAQYRTKRAKSMLEDSAFSSREDNESIRRSIIRLKSISDESDLIKVKNQAEAAASRMNSTDTENMKSSSPYLMDFAALILHEHKRAIQTSKTAVNNEDSSISYTQTTSSRRGSTFSSRQESSMSVGEGEINKQQQSPQQQREHVLVSKYSIDMRRANLKNSEGWYNRRKELRKSKKWSDATTASPDITDITAANTSLYYDITTGNSGNEVIIDQEISCTSSSNPPSNDSFGSKASPSASPKLRNQLPPTPVEAKPARKLPMIPNSPEQHPKRDTEKNKSNEDRAEVTSNHSNNNNNNTNEEGQQHQHEQQASDQAALSKALSKSIDSLESIKSRKSIKEIKERAPNYAKSVDLAVVNTMDQKPNLKLIHGSIISAQRSIDYPYIKRKNPPLSEIVRKRLLFKKLSHDLANSGDSFSNSVEKEHVPKTVRRIIIRQDNSIEIAITRPPRLRRQTFSEDVVMPNNTDGSINSPASSNAMRNMQTLSVSPNGGSNDRRKTIETCENIFLQSEESTKLRARTPPSNPHRILLYKDKSDKSIRKNGLGMTLSGGLECEDGSLGCFVTLVNKGGPADLNGIEVGDQILEFNGNSLIESTYEEVRNLQNLSGDYVQLVVHHNNVRYKHGSACSPLEISRHFETVPRLCPTETRKRRNLPPLPFGAEAQMQINNKKQQQREREDLNDYIVAEKIQVPLSSNMLKPILKTQGRLQMQIWNNCKELKLALTVNQASNLQLRAENEQSYILVVGRLTFEEQPTKTFRTNPVPSSLKPVWNETFLFDYNESIDEGTLEICAHETKSPNDLRLLRETFLGMIILPLSEANLEDEPRWYELRDKPTRKASTVSVTFKSSSNDSQESLCETKKPKKSSLRKASLSDEIGVDSSGNMRRRSSLSNAPIIKPVRKFSQALARLLTFRRNSESAIKKNIINNSDSASGDELFMDDQSRSALFRSKRSNQRRNTENVNLNFSIPKTILRNSTHSSLLSPNQNEIESDIDSYFSTEITTLNTTTTTTTTMSAPSSANSGRKSSNAGHHHKASSSSQSSSPQPTNEQIIGVIKLGFLMSKGQLEITIFEARLFIQKPLDTCVKTYLVAGRHKMLKKKSKLVKHTNKPVYNSKCTYNACNVLDRRIQVVMVSKNRHKSSKDEFIGEVLIHLAQLDLTHQTIAWYKLHPKSENSPNSDLNDSP